MHELLLQITTLLFSIILAATVVLVLESLRKEAELCHTLILTGNA